MGVEVAEDVNYLVQNLYFLFLTNETMILFGLVIQPSKDYVSKPLDNS